MWQWRPLAPLSSPRGPGSRSPPWGGAPAIDVLEGAGEVWRSRDGDRSSYPEAIAAINWERLASGWRDEEEVASLRDDLTREALNAMGRDFDIEEVSVMIDEHLRERKRDEEAHRECHRRGEASAEVAP